jgi:hypothetical protein
VWSGDQKPFAICSLPKPVLRTFHEAACLVLYDLSSSYFEGSSCPLARLGHNRDGKKGLLQVNYGLLTDARGCPVAVSVHEGNVADSATLLPEVQRLRERFGVEQLVMVGSPARPSPSCTSCRASTGSRRSRTGRSARWSSKDSCSWGCSTSATS